jgi:MFS family permease
MSIPEIISAISSPFIGILVDKFDKKAGLLAFASFLIAASHIMMSYTYLLSLPMVLFGIGYGLFPVAIWAEVPNLVDPSLNATAFGILCTALNLSLTILPQVVALIRKNSLVSDFIPVETFFIILATIGLIFSLLLHLQDDFYAYDLLEQNENQALCNENPQGRTLSIHSQLSTDLRPRSPDKSVPFQFE